MLFKIYQTSISDISIFLMKKIRLYLENDMSNDVNLVRRELIDKKNF